MNEFERMAELLLGHIDKEPEYYESLYPVRNLAEGARVVRIAPSPTGYLHLGTLFMALVNRITADSTGGIFYTRIEDTDKKREVEGGIDDIINGLIRFGINIDEGFVTPSEQKGVYGPYKQSERAEIYQCFAKKLVREGLAYPCFCTAEELAAVREEQEKNKIRTGYHGQFAVHRNITVEQAEALIKEGKPYVIRLKSPGNEEKRIFVEDGIKGKVEMPENDEDFVLLKSDGIPTYHFAHAVDDHLMRTTHVIRGDEWLSSVPKHIQLFSLLGFKPPKFCHVAPIMKLDNGAKRKISKRKDPEAAVHYFAEEGYDAKSVIEYLMTIASSEFEDWRRANPNEPRQKFKFNLKKMSVSGALFDGDKLNDVSKNIVSTMNSETVVEKLTAWAKEFDPEFYNILTKDSAYTKAVFAIDRDCAKPRKDIAKWNEAKEYCAYFFEELYTPSYEFPENIAAEDVKAFLQKYIEVYSEKDTKEEWFAKIKEIAPELGFAAETKEYKANKDAYKGSAGDLSTILRIAVTGRRNTPDLCSIMQVIGREECIKRLNNAISNI
ncbi:MAG: glutamate--tRNA ligase [Acutalibacteraceae bacterium]|nr:glutamate--tRNA ligase [Acutalibacteraceae bacterium]